MSLIIEVSVRGFYEGDRMQAIPKATMVIELLNTGVAPPIDINEAIASVRSDGESLLMKPMAISAVEELLRAEDVISEMMQTIQASFLDKELKRNGG